MVSNHKACNNFAQLVSLNLEIQYSPIKKEHPRGNYQRYRSSSYLYLCT